MRTLTVLGSTGTIGVNTLDVVARHPDRFRILALTANSQGKKLLEQCRQFHPRFAVLLDRNEAEVLQRSCAQEGLDTEVLCGVEALERVSALPEVDSVMAAIVGAAGLRPALAAARAGKRVLLANKETLVMAGHLFMEAVRHSGAELLPIDSEHNAVFQCLPKGYEAGLDKVGVRRILLTASGGPFRHASRADLEKVTVEQALNHPNWVMGRKITIDSATMMNKGLEVIEAHWLFGAAPEQIQVVVHPQSIIHSLVEYEDGSVLAELGNPDMRTPIAHALAYPERLDSGVAALDLFKVARLDFQEPDFDRFPCLALAYQALKAGGTAPAVLNAANEVAVEAFLAGRLSFLGIGRTIETALNQVPVAPVNDIDSLLHADAAGRRAAQDFLSR
jgi:1-deoxy-D-xylulose-5-phosphate reductoisomerase